MPKRRQPIIISNQQAKTIHDFRKKFGLYGYVLSRMEITQLKKILAADEVVESMIYGIHNGTFALLVATDQRLHFIDKRFFNSRIEDFDYLNIETIEYDMSILSGLIKMAAANSNIELRYAPNHLLNHFVGSVEYRMKHSRKRRSSKKNQAASSHVDVLERLSALLSSGYITREEFESEKHKIINGT